MNRAELRMSFLEREHTLPIVPHRHDRPSSLPFLIDADVLAITAAIPQVSIAIARTNLHDIE
jgi:hypothetical protein